MSVAPVTPEPANAAATAAVTVAAAADARAPVSVVILTKDEEHNIAGCIAGLSFTDDIVVVDSYSTDRTVEIARAFPNVRVYQRRIRREVRERSARRTCRTRTRRTSCTQRTFSIRLRARRRYGGQACSGHH